MMRSNLQICCHHKMLLSSPHVSMMKRNVTRERFSNLLSEYRSLRLLFTRESRVSKLGSRGLVHVSSSPQQGGTEEGENPTTSEALIARLRAAEEEAEVLKQQLEEAKALAGEDEGDQKMSGGAAKRIDGGDLRRETLSFVDSKSRNWLTESDVEFFTGGAPSEVSTTRADTGTPIVEEHNDNESSVVRRRLVIGLGLSAVVAAFAMVPTEKLQPPPPKPLFFYLIPLIRTQEILQEIVSILPDGDYERLRQLLARIEGPPNNIQQNLKAAVACLEDAKVAEKADSVGREVYEYIKGIDYQTYYESLGGSMGSRGGQALKEMFEYSTNSASAAQRKLEEFFNLMPQEQYEAAMQQVTTSPF